MTWGRTQVLAASLILASWNQSQLVADQQAARRPPDSQKRMLDVSLRNTGGKTLQTMKIEMSYPGARRGRVLNQCDIGLHFESQRYSSCAGDLLEFRRCVLNFQKGRIFLSRLCFTRLAVGVRSAGDAGRKWKRKSTGELR